jgi:hypothetical protein
LIQGVFRLKARQDNPGPILENSYEAVILTLSKANGEESPHLPLNAATT